MKRSLERWKAAPVCRTRPLPAGELRGHFFLAETRD